MATVRMLKGKNVINCLPDMVKKYQANGYEVEKNDAESDSGESNSESETGQAAGDDSNTGGESGDVGTGDSDTAAVE